MNDHDAFAVLRAADGCDDHRIGISQDDVAEPLHGRQWCECEVGGGSPCNSYCDTYGAAIVLLKDGRYATITEWSDTTGHG